MGQRESDDESTAAVGREIEREKTRFTVMLVVLVNAFLFSSCFFMGNSVFPVSSLYVKITSFAWENSRLFFRLYSFHTMLPEVAK